MAMIRTFRDLNVYQHALDHSEAIFEWSRALPRHEQYSLTDQIRRSSRAVGALVAEAWARRRYRAAFINKISQALAEAMETQAWHDHARSCGYLDEEQHTAFDDAWEHVGAMLRRMIQRADTFCSNC